MLWFYRRNVPEVSQQLPDFLKMDTWMCVYMIVGLQLSGSFAYDGKRPIHTDPVESSALIFNQSKRVEQYLSN